MILLGSGISKSLINSKRYSADLKFMCLCMMRYFLLIMKLFFSCKSSFALSPDPSLTPTPSSAVQMPAMSSTAGSDDFTSTINQFTSSNQDRFVPKGLDFSRDEEDSEEFVDATADEEEDEKMKTEELTRRILGSDRSSQEEDEDMQLQLSPDSFNLGELDAGEDKLESSFEHQGSPIPSPPQSQHSSEILKEQISKESLGRSPISETALTSSTGLYESTSFASSSSKPLSSSQRTYHFLSQDVREKFLSSSNPNQAGPTGTSTPRPLARSKLLEATQASTEIKYQFSPPIPLSPPPSEQMESKEREAETGGTEAGDVTPIRPFVFSPPFTRSASRQKKSEEFKRTSLAEATVTSSGRRKRYCIATYHLILFIC